MLADLYRPQGIQLVYHAVLELQLEPDPVVRIPAERRAEDLLVAAKIPPVLLCDTPGVTLLFKLMTLQRAPNCQAPTPGEKPFSLIMNGSSTFGLANAAEPTL